jgi:predicted XRE-type DNA-binding protein
MKSNGALVRRKPRYMGSETLSPTQSPISGAGAFLGACLRASGLRPIQEPNLTFGTTHSEALGHTLTLAGIKAIELASILGIDRGRVSVVLNNRNQYFSGSVMLTLEEICRERFLGKLAEYWHTQATVARGRSERQGGRR